MRKLITLAVLLFVIVAAQGQHSLKLHSYLSLNIDGPTAGVLTSNTGGLGLNLDVVADAGKKCSFFIQAGGDFFWGDKFYYIAPGGNHIEQHYKVFNLFGGTKLNINSRASVSLAAGPSFNTIFITSETNLAIKPALEFNFLKNRKLMARISYTNIFRTEHSEAYVGLAAGYRLF